MINFKSFLIEYNKDIGVRLDKNLLYLGLSLDKLHHYLREGSISVQNILEIEKSGKHLKIEGILLNPMFSLAHKNNDCVIAFNTKKLKKISKIIPVKYVFDYKSIKFLGFWNKKKKIEYSKLEKFVVGPIFNLGDVIDHIIFEDSLDKKIINDFRQYGDMKKLEFSWRMKRLKTSSTKIEPSVISKSINTLINKILGKVNIDKI